MLRTEIITVKQVKEAKVLHSVLQLILTIGCLLGDFFNCKKARICFVIWAICNVGWLFVDLVNGAYSRMVLDAVQICFNLYGLRQWSKRYKGGKDYEEY